MVSVNQLNRTSSIAVNIPRKAPALQQGTGKPYPPRANTPPPPPDADALAMIEADRAACAPHAPPAPPAPVKPEVDIAVVKDVLPVLTTDGRRRAKRKPALTPNASPLTGKVLASTPTGLAVPDGNARAMVVGYFTPAKAFDAVLLDLPHDSRYLWTVRIEAALTGGLLRVVSADE